MVLLYVVPMYVALHDKVTLECHYWRRKPAAGEDPVRTIKKIYTFGASVSRYRDRCPNRETKRYCCGFFKGR